MPSVAILGSRGYPSFYGGFETAVRHLAPYLAGNGWDVTVYSRRGSILRDPRITDERVHSITTPGIDGKSLSTLTYGFTSSVHTRKTRPDVALVLNVANGFWLPLLKQAQIPTAVNVDGIEWHRDKWGKLAKAVFYGGAKATARFADHLIFDAKAIQNFWFEEFGREGTYIPYGATFFSELPSPKLAVQGKPYVLMVARFVPENTVREFFEASKLISRFANVIVVGSSGHGGELDAIAQNLAEEYDNFYWLGHIHDDELLMNLWNHASVYFHGHSVGGTNPALVQAMALGRSIVALDTVYNREVLGDTGLFVSNDPSNIASAIQQLMFSSQSDTLGARALTRAQERFTWNLVCEQYEMALTDLCEEL